MTDDCENLKKEFPEGLFLCTLMSVWVITLLPTHWFRLSCYRGPTISMSQGDVEKTGRQTGHVPTEPGE